MPVSPGGRTSPLSGSTTLNSVCLSGWPTEPRTFRKVTSATLSYNVPVHAEEAIIGSLKQTRKLGRDYMSSSNNVT